MQRDLTTRLQRLVDSLLDAGWQPADLVHTTKRRFTQRSARLVVALLAVHARRTDAPTRAPDEWLRQLHELGAYHRARGTVVGGADDAVATWARHEKVHPDDVAESVAEVVEFLARLPRLSVLIPPPSAWGASNRGTHPTADGPSAEIDAKTLRTIRALLTKAESTTFEAEAASFTAKAQQLMARHAIDAAMLAVDDDGVLRRDVVSRRVHIDDPYADEKATLLAAIADVDRVRAVWSPVPGFTTLIGFPVDVQVTDLLFTSLLVQATRMSAEATAHDRRLRTASFRRAFLVAFADRVAERLATSQADATRSASLDYGDDLLPVLQRRDEIVESVYRASFPDVEMMPVRRLNAAGWYAGRAAGDRADLGAGAAVTRGD